MVRKEDIKIIKKEGIRKEIEENKGENKTATKATKNTRRGRGGKGGRMKEHGKHKSRNSLKV